MRPEISDCKHETVKLIYLADQLRCTWKCEKCGAEFFFNHLENSTYDDFVDEMWEYEPSEHGGMPELGYIGLAIAGEAGEVAEKIKKAYRERGGEPDNEALLKELGDVLYYIVKMAHIRGFLMHTIIGANIEKLKDRAARGKMRGEGDDR